MDAIAPWQIAFCALVLVAGYAVRGATGFGAGALAIPLIALVLPMRWIVPCITLLGFLAATGHIVQDRTRIAWRELLKLLPFTVAGVAAGLYLFVALSQTTLRTMLGAFVVIYALYSLLGLQASALERRLAPLVMAPVGVLSGLVATLFGGMAGPIYVVYLKLVGLDKTAFRVTIATILFILAAIRMIGYIWVGVFDRTTLLVFLSALPAMVVGMVLGNHVHARFTERGFSRFVAVTLMISGTALILK